MNDDKYLDGGNMKKIILIFILFCISFFISAKNICGVRYFDCGTTGLHLKCPRLVCYTVPDSPTMKYY